MYRTAATEDTEYEKKKTSGMDTDVRHRQSTLDKDMVATS